MQRIAKYCFEMVLISVVVMMFYLHLTGDSDFVQVIRGLLVASLNLALIVEAIKLAKDK